MANQQLFTGRGVQVVAHPSDIARVTRRLALRHLVALLLMVLAITNRAYAAPPTGSSIDAFLSESLEQTGLPGVAAAVVTRDGVIYLGGNGHTSDGKAVGPDTPFRVASISKSFTAFAVMQLVDQGKIDLNASIQKYLPDLKPGGFGATDMTVGQLLNQTSGMSDAGFPEMSRAQPANLNGAVARLSSGKVLSRPGTQWNYHNPNYHVLARLVEVVSGESFEAYLRRHIFLPLGMTRTVTVLHADETALGVADGYAPIYGFMTPRSIPDHFIGGSGGMISTARDMARWLQMNLNDGVASSGTRLISSRSLEMMHMPTGAVSGDYCFGWDIDRLPGGVKRIKHGGLLFTFSSEQALYPGLGYATVVLFNSGGTTGAEQMSIIDGIAAIVLGEPAEIGSPIGLYVDMFLLCITIAVVGLTVWQSVRARAWAHRWKQRPAWLISARMLLNTVPILLLVFLPTIYGSLFGGRNVTWSTALFAWPALIAFVAALALGSAFCLLLRARALRRDPAA